MKTKRFSFSASLVCALFFCSGLAHAQTVTINSVSGTSFCDGDSVSVTFTVTGFWGHRNAFTLQLSDPNGSFSNNFKNLGSIVDTLPGAFTIKTINSGNGGLHYRFRILAAIPYTISTDNGSDIAFWTKPSLYFTSSATVGSVGTPITFNNWEGDGTVFWNFGAGATPATANSTAVVTITYVDPHIGYDTSINFPPQSVTYMTPGDKVITLTSVNPGGCSATLTYSKLHIYDCSNPSIPPDAIVINSNMTEVVGDKTYWVNPGFSFNSPSGDTIFAEPGSTISDARSCIIYMKPGSVLTSGSAENVVIFGDGASIPAKSKHFTYFTLSCPSLDFDYTNAPPNVAHPLSSVKNDLNSVSITLSPNPTSGMLSVQGLASDNITVSIFNILGEMLIVQKNPPAPDFTLDLSKLVSGTYYIRFSSANSVLTKKIIKN